MSEQRLQSEILLAIGALPGVLAWRNNTGALRDRTGRLVRYGANGSADVLACVAGRFVALEVKKPGKPLRPDQAAWGRAVTAAGGVYRRVDTVAEAVRVVRGAMRLACK